MTQQAGEAGEPDLVLLVDLLEHPDTVSPKVGVSVHLGELVWLDDGAALLVIAVEEAFGVRTETTFTKPVTGAPGQSDQVEFALADGGVGQGGPLLGDEVVGGIRRVRKPNVSNELRPLLSEGSDLRLRARRCHYDGGESPFLGGCADGSVH